MNWELMETESLPKKKELFFFWVKNCPFGIVLKKDHDTELLIQPDTDSTTGLAVIPFEEFNTTRFWKFVIQLTAPHRIHLAAYSKRDGAPSLNVLLESLGISINYKTREEFIELGSLSEETMELGIQYDFNISVLRLFNRFTQEHKDAMISIINTVHMKKNYTREMIMFFYNLSGERKSEFINKSRILLDKPEYSGTESDEIIESLRYIRNPTIQNYRTRLSEIRNALKLSPGTRLQVVDDFESQPPEIIIPFNSLKNLNDSLEKLKNENNQRILKQLLDLME